MWVRAVEGQRFYRGFRVGTSGSDRGWESKQGLSLHPLAEFLTSGSTTAAVAAVAAAAAAFHHSLREPRRESTFRHIDRISSITAMLMGKFKALGAGHMETSLSAELHLMAYSVFLSYLLSSSCRHENPNSQEAKAQQSQGLLQERPLGLQT